MNEAPRAVHRPGIAPGTARRLPPPSPRTSAGAWRRLARACNRGRASKSTWAASPPTAAASASPPPDRKSYSGRQQCRVLTTPGYAELRAPSSQACVGDVPWASRASGSARGARRKVPRKLPARARAIFWSTSPRAASRAPSRWIPVNHSSAELKTEPNQFRQLLCLTNKNVLR